jgi:beta-mannosidase
VNSNKSISIGATVPGNIWTDLMRAGVIGDPYWRYNDIVYRWVGKEQWTYSRSFTLDSSWLKQKRILLVADGIDTVATILLNGQTIAWVNNMFRKVSSLLSYSHLTRTLTLNININLLFCSTCGM